MYENPWLFLISLLALALLFVATPAALIGYRRFRRPRLVTCPRDGSSASVSFTPFSAAFSEFHRLPMVKVQHCSLWPERAGCEESCVSPERLAA